MFCNDCKNFSEHLYVRGVSHLAGGEYYKGPEICEKCITKRREDAVVMHELSNRIDTEDSSFYHEC